MIAQGIRNAVKIVRKGTPNAYPSTDEEFNAQYAKQGLQPLGIGGDTREEDAEQSGVRFIRKNYRQGTDQELSPKVKLVGKAVGSHIAKQYTLKAWVTTVNNSAVAWSGFLWFFLQLPLALMFLATLALVGFIEGTVDASMILGGAVWAVNAITSVVSSVTGINLNISELAKSYMFILYVMIIVIGFFSLLIAHLQYSLALLNPLSGNKEGLKKGVFLLCLFGYSAPILNLFPWILLWLAVIWKYPK